ncbi:hypothetical protein A7981_05070 [Methylovorus sp. MM2]|uniref:hypothetical protein n=1 Tax=Methylovorus sp. MM2 TaxID=1848038 RepID=UPI0007E14527|nr:hypothetical protein [Methylovorus sp. MM2]OAM52814.1 hypothetical protein A7981_05070 [Methylovorus sp. MM2]
METRKMQSRTIDRALYFVLLEWVSDIGRFALRLLSLNIISFPKTDSLSYESEVKKQKGFVSAVRLSAKHFAIDMLYFFVGLVFLAALFLLAFYVLAKTFGPIPSIHEWR